MKRNSNQPLETSVKERYRLKQRLHPFLLTITVTHCAILCPSALFGARQAQHCTALHSLDRHGRATRFWKEMVKMTPALTMSSETVTVGGTHSKQLKRGKRGWQNLRLESGSEDSGINRKDVVKSKPTSRSVSPKASAEFPVGHSSRKIPAGGWPGSSSQRKAGIDPNNKCPPSSIAMNDSHVIPREKDLYEGGNCKSEHCHSDILKKHPQKRPYNFLGGASYGAREKRNKTSKKYHASDTSPTQILAGSSLTKREMKRLKTESNGSGANDSFDTLLLKVEEVSSKMNGPIDLGFSKKRGSLSKQFSKRTNSANLSMSIPSMSTYSGKSSSKSSRRSSARSVESMDGHTELLESLVHAAHAEDKLHKDKENLQRELLELEKRNEELEQELKHALKVMDKLRKKYKYASRDRHDMKKGLKLEKSKWENERLTPLKQEQRSSSKQLDVSGPVQKH